jgi:hypothetical protein
MCVRFVTYPVATCLLKADTAQANQVVRISAPCCDQCYIKANTVQLHFWPEHTTKTSSVLPGKLTKDVMSYVDDNDFTYISPSIYIAFNGLSATDNCGLVGSSVGRTTIGFDPSDISSILTRADITTCSYTMLLEKRRSTITSIWTIPKQEPLSSKLLVYSDVFQNCSSVGGYAWYTELQDWQNANGMFALAGGLSSARISDRVYKDLLMMTRSMPPCYCHPHKDPTAPA